MGSVLHDLRFAVRTLRRNPAITLVAVLTLALGIGANTAVFSVVSAVLLRPLPYPAADRLVLLWNARPGQPGLLASVPDVEEWRVRSRSFQDVGVVRAQSVNLTGTGTPDRLIGEFVDAHTLPILGAAPELGRSFADSDVTTKKGVPVAVLSHAVWATRFGADPAIVGRTLVLNGRPHVVIGVLSSRFEDPNRGVEVYLPITSAPQPAWLTRDDPEVWAVARLRPGVTRAAATHDLASVQAALAAEYPKTDAGLGIAVQPLRDAVAGVVRPSLLVVFAAVGFVLLIACANIANLQLARAAAREGELTVRAAVGAGRWRLAQQLLTESLLLSVLGGAAGVIAALWGTRSLTGAIPGGLPVYGGAVQLDARVLAFTTAITLGAGVLSGLAPALFAGRADLARSLGTRGGDGGRLRSTFVAVQLALCVVLLVGAGLLVRTIQRLGRADLGFVPDHVLTAEFRLPSNRYRTPEAITQFMMLALDAVRAIPGVRSAALVQSVPLSGNWDRTSFIPDDRPGVPAEQAPSTQINRVSDGFFGTMRIHVIAGRDFDARDRAGSLPVAVVDEHLARTLWPHGSAIGHRVQLLSSPPVWVTVIGVAANVKQFTIGEPAVSQVYVPVAQDPSIFSSIVLRTTGDPEAMANRLRAAIWSVDPNQPVWKVRSLDSLVGRDLAPPRFTALLTSAFAAIAVLLAALGVYGVMSYTVSRRTREVGIRVALGARREQVVALVLGRAVRVLVGATAAGVVAALLVAKLLAHVLYGVAAADPLTFMAAPAILLVVALAACWLPARRAARVDPVIALRAE